jgi:hypothetical protein
MFRKIQQLILLYEAYKDLKKIRSEMSQIEYYTGVEKDDNPELPKRYNELLNQRKSIIEGLEFI